MPSEVSLVIKISIRKVVFRNTILFCFFGGLDLLLFVSESVKVSVLISLLPLRLLCRAYL